MDTRRPKSERQAKDNLEKDSGEGKKQGRVGKLGGSQSGGAEQGVLDRKRLHLINFRNTLSKNGYQLRNSKKAVFPCKKSRVK